MPLYPDLCRILVAGRNTTIRQEGRTAQFYHLASEDKVILADEHGVKARERNNPRIAVMGSDHHAPYLPSSVSQRKAGTRDTPQPPAVFGKQVGEDLLSGSAAHLGVRRGGQPTSNRTLAIRSKKRFYENSHRTRGNPATRRIPATSSSRECGASRAFPDRLVADPRATLQPAICGC